MGNIITVAIGFILTGIISLLIILPDSKAVHPVGASQAAAQESLIESGADFKTAWKVLQTEREKREQDAVFGDISKLREAHSRMMDIAVNHPSQEHIDAIAYMDKLIQERAITYVDKAQKSTGSESAARHMITEHALSMSMNEKRIMEEAVLLSIASIALGLGLMLSVSIRILLITLMEFIDVALSGFFRWIRREYSRLKDKRVANSV